MSTTFAAAETRSPHAGERNWKNRTIFTADNLPVRLVLVAIFGRENFRNEVIWRYGKMSATQNKFPQNHDVILGVH